MLCGQDSLVRPEGLTYGVPRSVKQDLILGYEGLVQVGLPVRPILTGASSLTQHHSSSQGVVGR